MSRILVKRTPLALVGFVLLVLGSALTGDARITVINALLYASLGLAWNITGGYAGLFSFGHAAYFGIGAYSVAVMQVDYELTPWLAVPVAAIIAGGLAVLTTWSALRYRINGIFFALGTFAIAEMIRLLVTGSETLKRAGGYRAPLRPEGSWTWMQWGPESGNYYLLILGIFVVTLVTALAVASSRLGYILVAARDDEDAAQASGLDPLRPRLVASAISAALTSLCGIFYFEYFLAINPDLAFGQAVSVLILLPAIIGGVGTILGPIVGAVLLAVLNQVLVVLVSSPPSWFTLLQGRNGVDQIIYGATLILVILLLRHGVWGTARRRIDART
jgi:branched-chain amino acid transport system permease protein